MSHPIEFGVCGSLGGGPGGSAGGGDPLVGFGIRGGIGTVIPNWFRVGSDHASFQLTEGNIVSDVTGFDCSVVAIVQILVQVWS